MLLSVIDWRSMSDPAVQGGRVVMLQMPEPGVGNRASVAVVVEPQRQGGAGTRVVLYESVE